MWTQGGHCQSGATTAMGNCLLCIYRRYLDSQIIRVLFRLASADRTARDGMTYLDLYGSSARHGQFTSQAHPAGGQIEYTRLQDWPRSHAQNSECPSLAGLEAMFPAVFHDLLSFKEAKTLGRH